jgi:hypothetical protein
MTIADPEFIGPMPQAAPGAPVLGDMVAGVDLLGDSLADSWNREAKGIQKASRRLENLRKRGELRERGDPLEVAHYCMMEAFAKRDYKTAFDRAIQVLPFFAPRLNAVAVGVGAAGVGPGGRMEFTWSEAAQDVAAIRVTDDQVIEGES